MSRTTAIYRAPFADLHLTINNGELISLTINRPFKSLQSSQPSQNSNTESHAQSSQPSQNSHTESYAQSSQPSQNSHTESYAQSSQPSQNSHTESLAMAWLDRYFSGETPGNLPPLRLCGTPFQRRVWEELLKIPYGTSTTYGAIARTLNSSPRAVGNAVGANPLLIIVPCHRVLPASGALGGFSAGVAIKRRLLELEGIPFKED